MISKAFAFVVLLTTLIAPSFSHAADVVELFTSKYCPACPPADRTMAKLIETSPDTIALSCHVTYFDRENRTNLYSKDFCNARQSVYKLSLRIGQLFTPMAVVNGKTITKAKRLSDVKTALQKPQSPIYERTRIALDGQYVDITLPNIPLQQAADVWLFEYAKSPKQAGYAHYRNAVTKITKLMRWNGRKTAIAFPVNPGFDKGFAVVVQDFKKGILAAAKTP